MFYPNSSNLHYKLT